jgi:hypothetical protein
MMLERVMGSERRMFSGCGGTDAMLRLKRCCNIGRRMKSPPGRAGWRLEDRHPDFLAVLFIFHDEADGSGNRAYIREK